MQNVQIATIDASTVYRSPESIAKFIAHLFQQRNASVILVDRDSLDKIFGAGHACFYTLLVTVSEILFSKHSLILASSDHGDGSTHVAIFSAQTSGGVVSAVQDSEIAGFAFDMVQSETPESVSKGKLKSDIKSFKSDLKEMRNGYKKARKAIKKSAKKSKAKEMLRNLKADWKDDKFATKAWLKEAKTSLKEVKKLLKQKKEDAKASLKIEKLLKSRK